MPLPLGHYTRSRPLAHYEKKFGSDAIKRFIAERRPACPNQRILEIGCGEGRVLLELHKLFPGLELHGINKKPWPAMTGTQSLLEIARHHGIYALDEIDVATLPQMHFYDACKLDFPDNYFDLIISQVCFPYISRKDLLLEDVWRSLKVGGKALLELDCRRSAPEADFLTGDAPCFIIYNGHQRLPLSEFFVRLQRSGVQLQYHSATHALVLVKSSETALRLGLTFDEISSFELSRLQDEATDPRFWGFRSVFRLMET